MVGEEVTKEQPGVRTKLGKGFGGEPAIVVEKFQRGKEGQPREKARGEPEIYDLPKNVKRTGDAQTLFGQIQRALDVIGNNTERGVALREEEFKEALSLISETSGGGREYRWELGQFAGQMIIDASKNKEDPEKIWKTLADPNTNAKDRGLLRQENPEMALVVDYLTTYGASPERVNWGEVLVLGEAIEAIRDGKQISDKVWEVLSQRSKDPAKTLAAMKNKTWKDKETQLKALENMLGMHQKEIRVDVMGFWKKELLKVVEARLESMRSPVSARIKPDKDGIKYLDITRSRDVRKPIHEGDRVYASRLAIHNLAGNTLLGGFLDEMHKGEFWRGKADLDYLYWSLYMGQFIDDEKAQDDERMHDIFARLKADDVMESGLRGYSGPNTLSRLAKDPLFVEALQQLYTVPDKPGKRLNQEERLNGLVVKYGFDPKRDLPTWVTDAVMLSQVFALDAKHLTSSDRRYTVYFLAEYYKEAAVNFKNKRVAEIWGGKNGVIEMLGFNFRFTETPLVKGWFIDPLNMDVNYHAFVDDDRQFDPEKYPDQLDKVWQNMFMFCLEGRKDSLRRLLEKDVDVSYSVGPGQGGEYCGYDNDRWIQKKGEERVFDHRGEVYKHIGEMLDEDAKLLSSHRRRGKAGWDEDLRKDVKTMLDFLKSVQSITIDGVTIETNGGEIFYNDELAKLLDRYEEVRNTPQAVNQFSSQDIGNLENFLTMRNVLRDQRAWGWVYSMDLNESDMFERLELKKDLMLATLYDMAGGPAKDAMRKLINVAPFQTMGEMSITPASILAAALEFGHRYQKVQFYPTLFKVYQFAETCLMMRMSQLEIPDAQTLAKIIDSVGEVRFGVWGEAFKQAFKKEMGSEWEQLFKDQKALWETAADLGYLEKMVFLHLTLIEKGFYETWDDAISAHALRELAAEAMQWIMTRQLPVEQKAGIYRKLARYLNPYLPVLSYQVPDVVVTGDGKDMPEIIIARDLVIEDLNRTEKKLYFEEIPEEKAGAIFGGIRTGIFLTTPGTKELDLKEEPGNESKNITDIKGQIITTRSGMPINVYKVWQDQNNRIWMQIGFTVGDEQKPLKGWVQLDDKHGIRNDAQNPKGYVREGERMFEGGRFIWQPTTDKTGKNTVWSWKWRTGIWKSDLEVDAVTHKTEQMYFIPDPEDTIENGFRKEWHTGEGKWEEGGQMGKDGWAHEANYPFLRWKSEEARAEFMIARMHLIYQLLFGKRIEATAIRGGGAKVKLDRHYPITKEGDLFRMGRWAYWIQTKMRKQEKINACRGLLLKVLKEDFGIEGAAEADSQRLISIYEFMMQSRIWGEDLAALMRFNKELSLFDFFNKKKTLWHEKTLSGLEKTGVILGNLGLRAINKFLLASIPLGPFKLNIVAAAFYLAPRLIVGGLGLLGRTLAAMEAIPQITAAILVYFAASGATTLASIGLNRLVQVKNLKDIDLNKCPYLDKAHAYVVPE